MADLVDIQKEFTEFLNSINTFETTEKIVKVEGQSWPTLDKLDLVNNQILPEIKKMVSDWQEIIEFISFGDFFYIKDLFKKILLCHRVARHGILSANEFEFNDSFNELKEAFRKLKFEYLSTGFKFFPDKVDKEMEVIVDFIQRNFFKEDSSFSDLITFLKSQKSEALNYDITEYIVDYKNKHPDIKATEKFNLVRGIYAIYNNYLANNISLEREELINEKNRIEKELADERIKLEQDKNAKLITAFGEKARTMNDAISIFYFLIYGTFSIIIASIFFKMNSNIDISFKDLRFIYFFSYIAILSTLLTFFIKEKNNLSKQRDYFNRCHVELEALATYTSGFEKEQIIRLKLELAQKYFSAGQNDRNETLSKDDSPVTSEQFKQTLDLIKNLMKK
ncbi:hypothetical protein OPU61_001453 [Acinetobacter baumannii]|nr:hypothetical protein [Acinetobacter baumannii]